MRRKDEHPGSGKMRCQNKPELMIRIGENELAPLWSRCVLQSPMKPETRSRYIEKGVEIGIRHISHQVRLGETLLSSV